jgi:hypothetical protein
MVSFGSSGSAIPVTFCEDVMDVLQTTSTKEFNLAFDYQKLRAANRLTKGVPFDPSFDEILDAAIDLYGQMIRDNSWLGSKHKARETAFLAQINAADKRNPTKTVAPTCWNCGKIGNRLNKCRAPPNPERQERMRQEFRANRSHGSNTVSNSPTSNANSSSGGGRGRGRGRGSGRGGRMNGRGGRGNSGRNQEQAGNDIDKYCPPAPFENNRRHIRVNGRYILHTWNSGQNKWNPTVNIAAATGSPAPTPNAPTQGTPNLTTNTNAAQHRVNIANLQQQVNNIFANMLTNAQE